MSRLKTELWNFKGKKRKVFIVRENGQIQSWKPVKGTNLTVKQASSIYKNNNTFNEDEKRIIYKGGQERYYKHIDKRTVFKKTTLTSRRLSDREVEVGNKSQVKVMVLWFNRKGRAYGKTEGFSDWGLSDKEARKQAFQRAKGGAVLKGWFRYDSDIEFEAEYTLLTWKFYAQSSKEKAMS